MKPARPGAATAAEPVQRQPVVPERVLLNPDRFGHLLLQCTKIGVCCIASNGICVGPSPHASPRPDRTLPLSGLFFCLREKRLPFRGHALPNAETFRAVVWEPTLPLLAFASRTGDARAPVRRLPRIPTMPAPGPAFASHADDARDLVRALPGTSTMRALVGSVPGRPHADLPRPVTHGHQRGDASNASGLTTCTSVIRVLPGSSHGTMCAECSNHTACLKGACTFFNQRSVGAVGVV